MTLTLLHSFQQTSPPKSQQTTLETSDTADFSTGEGTSLRRRRGSQSQSGKPADDDSSSEDELMVEEEDERQQDGSSESSLMLGESQTIAALVESGACLIESAACLTDVTDAKTVLS
ncbi:hypothetical protein ACOMHN_060956 [Nucella lapillus]